MKEITARLYKYSEVGPQEEAKRNYDKSLKEGECPWYFKLESAWFFANGTMFPFKASCHVTMINKTEEKVNG